jgi:hypothetical protein
LPVDGDQKRGNTTRPLLLVSLTHKDGRFKKIWLPSNRHNFSDGDWSFQLPKKGVMPHVFKNFSTKVWQKFMTTPFWGD